jgi:hypothetical protein
LSIISIFFLILTVKNKNFKITYILKYLFYFIFI